jgi:hypothetical protein
VPTETPRRRLGCRLLAALAAHVVAPGLVAALTDDARPARAAYRVAASPAPTPGPATALPERGRQHLRRRGEPGGLPDRRGLRRRGPVEGRRPAPARGQRDLPQHQGRRVRHHVRAALAGGRPRRLRAHRGRRRPSDAPAAPARRDATRRDATRRGHAAFAAWLRAASGPWRLLAYVLVLPPSAGSPAASAANHHRPPPPIRPTSPHSGGATASSTHPDALRERGPLTCCGPASGPASDRARRHRDHHRRPRPSADRPRRSPLTKSMPGALRERQRGRKTHQLH